MADEDALNRLEIAADQVASQNAAAVDSLQHSDDLVEMVPPDCRHLNTWLPAKSRIARPIRT